MKIPQSASLQEVVAATDLLEAIIADMASVTATPCASPSRAQFLKECEVERDLQPVSYHY